MITENMDEYVKDIKKKFVLPSRFKSAEQSIWNESSALKQKYHCIDLSQGFPNYLPFDSPVTILHNVANSDDHSLHQYTRSYGHERLVNALAALYSTILGRKINASTEILVTCGAYEALYSAITGNIEKGDEVIIVEPFFDCYEPMVLVAGGIVKHIPLRNCKKSDTLNESSADWKLDEAELRKLFNKKTKMIIINTPMNPLGKVFTKGELTLIAELCIKYDSVCVSDEVYEWMVFEPAKHIKIATLPGMWDRTVTIGSAGKSFCVTGWKCGWSYGPPSLIDNARVVHRTNVYTIITPIQEAVAQCIEKELDRIYFPECLFNAVKEQLRRKRDYFVHLLTEAGFRPIVPEAGYFIIADWTNLKNKIDLSSEDGQYEDYKLMKWMVKNIGLLSIPPSVFFSEVNKCIGENQIRFCFFKTEETLNEAAESLNTLKSWTEKKKIKELD